MLRVNLADGGHEVHNANRCDIGPDGSLQVSWAEVRGPGVLHPGGPMQIEMRLVKIYRRDLWLTVVTVEEPGDLVEVANGRPAQA